MTAEKNETDELGALTATAVRVLRMSHFTIERAADMLFWIDEEGRIRRVNEAACRALGRPRDELMGKTVAELVAADAPHPWPDFWPHSERTLQRETALRTGDGESLPVEVAINHIEFDGRAFNCAAARDITERKQAEGALRDALAEVEQLKNRLQEENVYLRDEIRREHDFQQIVGQSEPLRRVLRKVEQVAATDASVLILGESGTGKELIARAVHDLSGRKERPLVKVNCAALPENLIESELFGHEKGAFTGALTRRTGRFELADGGTIFLDEIGDLPLALQAKLLRVLQEGEFERLGDPRTRKVDVRVIAATNHDLERAVDEGRFRADLFYRLNVFPVQVPPLRERIEDIASLAHHFADKYGAKMGRRVEGIAPEMLEHLCGYSWPGNVRELENVIERAVILSPGGPLTLDEPLSSRQGPAAAPTAPRTLRQVEVELIRQALEACNWVIGGKKGAAARLDMAPSTLRERMQRYGIERLES